MNIYKTSDWLFKLVTLILSVILVSFVLAYEVFADVDPANFETTLSPGESVTIEKYVTTPPIPQDPEICFLADTTGSMQDALDNVKQT